MSSGTYHTKKLSKLYISGASIGEVFVVGSHFIVEWEEEK